MNISSKIWLSISALVLGYLVTVTVNSLLGLYAERRLADTATTLFPATTLGRVAEVDYKAQMQAFADATLTGDQDQIAVALAHAKAVQQGLAELLALASLSDERKVTVSALRDHHRRYTEAAPPTYRSMAQNKVDARLAKEAAELHRQADSLQMQFAEMVEDLTGDLTGELAQTVARSEQQRHVSLAVLVIAAGVSIVLVYVVIARWTRRLAELMQASERLARGDFSVSVAKSGHDEIGRLAHSFAVMQDAISARSADLQRFTESLEDTVRLRTRQISDRNTELVYEIEERQRAEAAVAQLHNQLLDASRRAGMAEVATGVLHNVGNVLNSVNVSANLISERMRDSRSANLAKAAEMMLAQAADLGRFMQEDPRGRQLPGYLAKLAEHISAQHAEVVTELGGLLSNIEHIKEIVQLQQTYGKSIGVLQKLRPQEVAEEALRLSGPSLKRHDVQVVRELADLPPMQLDRHKILQILVNLISNAKHALDEASADQRMLTVRTRLRPGNRLEFSVSDNGVGIPPENLQRIFTHGFTTKKEGHGFGLHSCANAAIEMQGTVTVESQGVGHGATFTLELPIVGAAGAT
jgi:signal transduction histidine kinase